MARKLWFGVIGSVLVLGVGLPAQQYPPGTWIPHRFWRRRPRRSAKRTCGASRSRVPATADRWDRRSRTRPTSIGSAARWPITRGRSTGRPGRARRRSIGSPAATRVMEVRHRMGRRHARTEGSAPDAHREWRVRLAHRRQRHTCRGASGAGRGLSARHLADSARLFEGREEAGRESQGSVALGAARERTRRQRRRAREGARCRDHRCSASTALTPRSTARTSSPASRRR